MVFSSLLFLFLFLPLTLIFHYMIPRRFYSLRNLLLLFVSLILYGWGEPVFVLLMIFSIVLNYTSGFFIGKYSYDPRMKKLILIISIAINLGLLGFFKYAGFFCSTIKSIPMFSSIEVPNIALPIGISFYTFQAMSYSIDVYRKDTTVQKSLVSFGTYVSLFPQLIAGPIVKYKDIDDQLGQRKETLSQFNDGVKLFLIGLAKKVLIANQMGIFWHAACENITANGMLGAWIGIISFAFQIYFDFSGYSDMALGLGKMFGFEFLINFNYPYISQSITDFWRRWHMSLSTWFKEYLYIPLGGNRKGKKRQILNLLIVWFLTGLWHGASWNFVIWGLYFGIILIFEKLFLLEFLKGMPSFVKHFYTMFLVLIGWVIFSFDKNSDLLNYFETMFSIKNGIINSDFLVKSITYLPLFLIAIVASTPFGKNLYHKVKDTKMYMVFEPVIVMVVLLVCTSKLVSQSYNPFLYFRF